MTTERDIAYTRSVSRRGVIKLSAAATAALGMTAVEMPHAPSTEVAAHVLLPGQFGSPLYDNVLNTEGGVKAVFQSPNVEATGIAGKNLNHFLLLQLKNWLNAYQFSYQVAPADLHTIVALYGSTNLFTYADASWEKYRLGEKYNIVDPATGVPSIRNVFWPSRFDPNNTSDPDDPQSFYKDSGIEALQKRGAYFLC